MPDPESRDISYEFLDCGNGRRLERYSTLLAVRPAPAASRVSPRAGELWQRANVRFEPGSGWTGTAPDDWRVRLGGVVMGLRQAAQGQVGVFPEHETVCRLLREKIRGAAVPDGGVRVLNLFAHTGLATLSLAALPEVGEAVHVDAARRAVADARENARLSGLNEARIRWLADDALAFAEREVRRGRTYDLILADPPSHGRDRKSGREWRFERDVPRLLDAAAKLLASRTGRLCVTFHSEGWTGGDMADLMAAVPGLPDVVETHRLALVSAAGGNSLDAGHAVVAEWG